MSRHKRAEVARKNLDKRLGPIREANFARPAGGWIRAVREALGMTTRQLAHRMDASQSWVSELEKAEARGNPTLKSLREAAEAMDCKLVYALVPKQSLDEMVKGRAREKAVELIAQISHDMLLENQSLTKQQMQEELTRMTDEILEEPIGQLWEKA